MLKELLDDQIYNAMGCLVRWNNRLRHKDETNATHTFYTVLYTDKLCEEFERAGEPIDHALAMRLAIRHDIEEPITGDLPRGFKASEQTGELAEIIDRTAHATLNSEDFQMWHEVQVGETKEAQVVVLADWLAGMRYMLLEARLGCHEILRNGIKFLKEDAKKIKRSCPICKRFFKEIDEIIAEIVKKETNDAKK